MRFLGVVLLVAVSAFNVSCSNKNSSQSKRYFVQGDPIAFVADTRMDMSGMNLNQLKSLEGYHLNSLVYFEQVSEAKSAEEFINEQKTNEGNGSFVGFNERDSFKVKEGTLAGKTAYKYSDGSSNVGLIFGEDASGNLIVREIFDGRANYKVNSRYQHFSITKNANAFTILVYDDSNESNKGLIAFYFTRPFTFNPEKAFGDYDFISGKNLKVRWARGETVGLNICSPKLQYAEKHIKASLGKWTAHVKSTNFYVNYLESPPPFSDLNTQCIYLVDSYFTLDSTQFSNPAAVFPYFSNEMIDADMLLFEKELNKSSVSYTSHISYSRITRVITHELGHFLGLDHPEDIMAPKERSIMSYASDNKDEVYARDIESIRALYE